MPITIEVVRKYFQKNRVRLLSEREFKPAGVLILLFEKERELHVVLTRRTDEVEHHKGQVSFPGGTRDASDADIVDTALREAEEEIGIGKKNIEVLGKLSDYCTPSGFCITPVVGFLGSVPLYTISEREVTEVFDVPLSFFKDRSHEQVREHKIDGESSIIYSYIYGKHEIWGATAAILRSFLYKLNVK